MADQDITTGAQTPPEPASAAAELNGNGEPTIPLPADYLPGEDVRALALRVMELDEGQTALLLGLGFTIGAVLLLGIMLIKIGRRVP
jgi:hypothetical protein